MQNIIMILKFDKSQDFQNRQFKPCQIPALQYQDFKFVYYVVTVQLKGNLTHVDRAHATYWLKASGFINLYWHVWERKPAKFNF